MQEHALAELPSEQSSTAPNIPDIVRRYLSGESLQTIAQESELSVRTLYRWMLSECGPEYDDVVTQAIINRIAEADLKLAFASDSCQVARAREMARFARMDFERRRPKLYGQKSEMSVDKQVTVVIQRDQPKAIDVSPLAISSSVASHRLENDEKK
jgi:hypothetical protein